MRIQNALLTGIVIALLGFAFMGCDLPTQQPGQNSTGSLTIFLSDAPFPADSVESATVSIDSIDIRTAGESGNTSFMTIFRDTDNTSQYNLLDLRNGVTATLAEQDIPTGEYDLVRVFISDASISLKNGTQYDLKVPSGMHTGLKIFIRPSLMVRAGMTTQLLIDVDVSKSFVARGSMHRPGDFNGFIFKPVLRAANLTAAGKINGTVSDSLGQPFPDVSVWVEQADTVVTSTLSSNTGGYALIGLAEGDYVLRAVATGFDTTTVDSDVTVTTGEATTVDFQIPTP